MISLLLSAAVVIVSARSFESAPRARGCEWHKQPPQTNDEFEKQVLYCQIGRINSIEYLSRNMSHTDMISVTTLVLEIYLSLHNSERSAITLELNPESFRGLGELRNLQLADNNIWSMHVGLLCHLYSLLQLNLSGNKFKKVSALGFSEWGNGPLAGGACANGLEVLDLSFNGIISLSNDSFSALRSLEKLFLQNNAIFNVAGRAFFGLTSLKTLNLSSNYLVGLPPDVFLSSRELHHLYLHNNSLSVLGPGILEGLDQLQVLDLSVNELTIDCIDQNTFTGLVRLVVLNLAHNLLSKIDSNVFDDLYSLQTLNLDYNHVVALLKELFSS
ncbi:hypothetical protein JTB14_034642 [Gonioctena quinquepunctata]|nr:hypothetical protein JTB14_034642 [Gonioctena quinquepunctata]